MELQFFRSFDRCPVKLTRSQAKDENYNVIMPFLFQEKKHTVKSVKASKKIIVMQERQKFHVYLYGFIDEYHIYALYTPL